MSLLPSLYVLFRRTCFVGHARRDFFSDRG
jgi:hypothetical protein